MRAVNQSIGRAIRHAKDFGTILLVDRSTLPKKIGEDVQTPGDKVWVARGISALFREKRERGKL
ncbi:hypothetical protein JCM24511_08101 [Saitozyma sp. JCM 24511]|nr:hypothetical protein JCM24511_08101 [Saitozyma sp. JCM 24511]